MRQYKFRGKRIDNLHWVYGSLITWPSGEMEIIACDSNTSAGKISVIPETVGQFTNKLDSQLLDVYGGDIVQGGNGKMWVVSYCLKVSGWIISNKLIKDAGNNKFAGEEEYSFDTYRKLCKKASTDTFKKIGNIWDNPELLNAAGQRQPVINMTTDPKEGQEQEAATEEATQPEATETKPETTQEG